MKEAKPFLRWVGGKGQILPYIRRYYPFNQGVTKYAEPFVGGGAVLFDILNQYDLSEVYISDTNNELINAYKIVRDNPEGLLCYLEALQTEYMSLSLEGRKEHYLERRREFNEYMGDSEYDIERAALMIYLNKTCFNGLYRVNRKGEFNVSGGMFNDEINICDSENIIAASRKLKNVIIKCRDYREVATFADSNTFVYFDPPYRPLTNTSNFNRYTERPFNEKKQVELATFARELTERGVRVLLSNSDPKNTNPNDKFFDELYAEFNIDRIRAARCVNCKVQRREKISELLISYSCAS